MDTVKNIFRMCVIWLTLPLVAYHGSRKLHKWNKKNKKEQDPNIHPFKERIAYHRKKMKGVVKRFGIKIIIDGIDNIPKGAVWITPNHTSNLDGVYLSCALGSKLDLIPVAKKNLKENKFVRGYFTGIDGMFLDRKSPRQSLSLLDGASQYAKSKNKAITIFPEGMRSLSGEVLEFKNGLFKFPQKYFLPILPVTIVGTLEAKTPWSFKTRIVKVIVHKPIKPIEHSKIPTEIISKRIRGLIIEDLKIWKKSLTKKQFEKHIKLSNEGAKKFEKNNSKEESK
ncbi:MAG: 1-acyl-sn-glycerol-3-phosphate acyltransferase [Mycoplasmataceae bacterium]|nr:1-acyl-sn-glycerol-3-phosphate acyltransferase [Mycoplasmataceae bacterium]